MLPSPQKAAPTATTRCAVYSKTYGRALCIYGERCVRDARTLDDELDLGLGAQHAFDGGLEHAFEQARNAWATSVGANHAHLHHALADLDELHAAAVGLHEGRNHIFKQGFDSFSHRK